MEHLSLTELKALAYDILAKLQAFRAQLDQVNSTIATKVQAADVPAGATATPPQPHPVQPTNPTTNTF